MTYNGGTSLTIVLPMTRGGLLLILVQRVRAKLWKFDFVAAKGGGGGLNLGQV